MRRTITAAFLLALLLLTDAAVHRAARAQGTVADYERAAALPKRFSGKVTGTKVSPHWIDQGKGLWYSVDRPGGQKQYVVVDVDKGTRRDVAERPPEPKPAPAATASPPTSSAKPRAIDRTPPSSRSPDGAWQVVIVERRLQLKSKAGEASDLSPDLPQGWRWDTRFFWSPDAKHVVAIEVESAQSHPVHLLESSPKTQLQPLLHTHNYLKPGDKIDRPRPRLFRIADRKEIAMPNALFETPWSLDRFRWRADGSEFSFLYNQRGHGVVRLVGVSAETGQARSIVEEKPGTFVDYTNKVFLHWLSDDALIWMSERDGWNHLYLCDVAKGAMRRQLTQGAWLVRGVERVDEERQQIEFRCLGIDPAQDPYHVHYARVSYAEPSGDGPRENAGLVRLTQGDGTHALEYSPDRSLYLDRFSRVDLPTVTELRRTTDGSLVCELERGDASLLEAEGWHTPERFVAKGRDGATDIHGVIHRPIGFQKGRKYPVIEKIYAGPHGHFVPKAFAEYHSAQAMAELGFILVQVDGMGTNWRSKAFHDVCWKNLGDSGFPDRMLWIRAAAAKYPEFDLTRVGIYGGSAGGQSTLRALLAFGDFYHVGVADCGCHDNRMDKIWWNEQWMSWPIGPHYDEQSNVTQAHRLKGKLLLTLGELDRNVDPASTMQVVNALIKANKDFDFVLFPGGGHGIGESPYGQRRRADFFVRHLLGAEPRAK